MEHLLDIESDMATETVPVEAPPKRKRGRPPKNRAATAAAQTPTSHPGADGSTQPAKRGRGRPPKNRTASAPAAAAAAQIPDSDPADNISQPAKRRRGRPPGTKNKVSSRSSSALVPHVLTVHIGEDVYEKLRDLSTCTGRSVVVLAATGLLSAATLMQLNSSGEAVGVTLKGTFTILGLSGALLQSSEHSGHSHSARHEPSTQFLSASLANPSGGVIGGTVAGALEAASPVLVVVGHWDSDRAATSSDAEQALSPQSAAAAAAQVGLTGLLQAAAAAGAGGLLLGLAGLPGQAVDWPDEAAGAAGEEVPEAAAEEDIEEEEAQRGEDEAKQQEEEDPVEQGSGGDGAHQDYGHANGAGVSDAD